MVVSLCPPEFNMVPGPRFHIETHRGEAGVLKLDKLADTRYW